MTVSGAFLVIVICIYLIIISRNMILFRGRQRDQILTAIQDENKARQYGKAAGKLFIITGAGMIAFSTAWLITRSRNVNFAGDVFLLICLFAILRTNKKWSGKYGITIY